MSERALWNFIGRHLQSGRAVALLAVVASAGSSPGRTGFRMAVAPDGTLRGSIGGGIMESKLVELARERLKDRHRGGAAVKRQVHRADAPRDRSGMICSGEQTVALIVLSAGSLDVVRRIVRCLKNRTPAVLQLGPDGIDLQENRSNERAVRFEAGPADAFVYEENIGRPDELCIVGAGHCGLALSRLMRGLGFYVRLYDDRPGLNTFRENRWAHERLVLDSYERIGEHLPHGPNVYTVVMTLGYRSDAVVIRALIDRDFAYFGVLGSAAKMQVLLRELEAEGLPADWLQRLHTPVGLPINSRTPAEIAVSIAAEIIAVRNRPPGDSPGRGRYR